MRTDWESHLERWTSAGVLDSATAGRIRVWESEREQSQGLGLRWPILIALAFGVVLLAAGVLLFVSAHWDELSAAERMLLVLLMVAGFHAGGAAVAARFENLSVALHTVGTASLGAAIALTGQIFHLSAHWPAAVLLWAVGAALASVLLGHWTQVALTAILVPWWIAGEWMVWMPNYAQPVAAGLCALSFTYLSSYRAPGDSAIRIALACLGGAALIPAALGTAVDWRNLPAWQASVAVAWTVALAGPLLLAVWLRGRQAWWNALAILWTALLAAIASGDNLLLYVWCLGGAVGLAYWGIREARPERINVAMAGFAITVLAFYFSSVMDKLDRSASLIGLGLLFLGGGWLLERTRRRLIAHIRPEAS